MAIRPRMRPTFEIPMKIDGTRTMARLKTRLERGTARVTGQVVGRHAYLKIPSEQQSLLSPHLNLQLLDRGGRIVLHGRFGPRPNVWTGFMAVYGVLALTALGGLMLGWAQTTVDEYPWGFWLTPAAAALIAFVYGAAVIGQGLTQDEMYLLRNFVDHLVTGDERDEADREDDWESDSIAVQPEVPSRPVDQDR